MQPHVAATSIKHPETLIVSTNQIFDWRPIQPRHRDHRAGREPDLDRDRQHLQEEDPAMTDSTERPRVLSAASRSIFSSNRRIVTCKSSACSFSAATASTNQDARVAVTVPSRAIPPIISPKATRRPTAVTG